MMATREGLALRVCFVAAIAGGCAPAGAGSPPESHAVATASALVASGEQKLAPAAVDTFDSVGAAVAASGASVAIRADAYVALFERSGSGWVEAATIVSSPGLTHELGNAGLGLDGDTLLVGSSHDDEVASWAGAAFVFLQNGTTWAQQATLHGSLARASHSFGSAVAVDGNTAVVSAREMDPSAPDPYAKVYVFTRNGSTWTEQAILRASPQDLNDEFGASVAIEGDLAVIGAPDHWVDTEPSGAAFVFERSGTTWTQLARLEPSDPASTDDFGRSVDLASGIVAVGAPREWEYLTGPAGHAYVFVRNGTGWSQQAMLSASDASDGNGFGASVGLSGGVLVVGAPGAGDQSGAAYVFRRSGTTWTEAISLVPSDGSRTDEHFGHAIAIARDAVFVGRPDDSTHGSGAGSVHAYILLGLPCSVDAECTSGFCTDGLCCERRCDDVCHSCALPSSEGSCTPVLPGATDDTCQAPLECGPGAACGAPGAYACTSNGDCASGSCSDGFCCDSACDAPCDVCAEALGATRDGQCTLAPRGYAGDPNCGSFACTGLDSACGAGPCDEDADCAAAFRCDTLSGNCVARDTSSCDGDHTVTDPGGTGTTNCSPYLCEVGQQGGVCKKTCAATADCVAGFVCDLAASQCVRASQANAGSDTGSCGCRTPGSDRRAPREAWGLVALAWLAFRRRLSSR